MVLLLELLPVVLLELLLVVLLLVVLLLLLEASFFLPSFRDLGGLRPSFFGGDGHALLVVHLLVLAARVDVVDVRRLLELAYFVGVDLVFGDGVDLAEPGQVLLVLRINVFQLF